MKSLTILTLASIVASATAFSPITGIGLGPNLRSAVLRSTSSSSTALSAGGLKNVYEVAVFEGDGIGPEITAATIVAAQALQAKHGFKINFTPGIIGGQALDQVDHPFPDDSLAICRKSDSILLSCIGGYKWDKNSRDKRPETGLLRMRKELNLFANLRPAKVLPQLIAASTLKPEIVDGVDIMVVRELTGDVYFGEPKGIDTLPDGERVGYNNMIYKESEIRRIARVAGKVASSRGGNLVSIDKANVLDISQLWREVVTDVCETEYPSVDLSHMYVDNAAMQLIRWPKQFDTIVCGNIFGDILSDEASMLVGSLGMLPSASLGEEGSPGVYEPCHGSAPDIAGLDKANPLAMILSLAMMMKYDLGRPESAEVIERAVEKVLDMGYRTPDIKLEGDGKTLIGTKAMGELVADAIANS
jgi:3-isopropylmalate dehydrogenase